MRKLIGKTFGLRDGEIYISFLMQLYIFIVITVLLIVKPTINALFVSRLGADHLPYGYLLVAVVAVITSYFYNKAIRKFSLVKVTVISLIIFSLSFIALGILIQFSLISEWLLYFYYLIVSLFAVIATSQFWIFANMVFNAREAKRIFGFIGAGAIAGGIFGGYLTSLIASAFGNEFAIFAAAILILSCIPIIRKVWKLRIRAMNLFRRKQRISDETNLAQSSLKLIYNSKHLLYIALITGISVVVAKLIDFQFSDFANKAIPDSDKLAAFFGFWFSTFNVAALTIQLFLTNKVLTRLGVSSTLLILPLAIALGSLLFLTFPELWVLVIIKGIDGSFKQSLNKAAVELSIMPIPLLIKNQAKSYIDVAVDSIATGFAGFLLIFLVRKLELSTSYITVIILFFVFIWILLIYRLREAYFNSFKVNIQRTLSVDSEENQNKKKENTISKVKNVLENGDEESILNLLDRLDDYKVKSLQSSVFKLLDHPSNRIKEGAIDYFYSIKNDEVLEKVKQLVLVKDDSLVYTALDYILLHSSFKEDDFFDSYLDHENEYIANAALLVLAKVGSDNSKLAIKYNLNSRLESKIYLFNYSEDNLVRKEVIAGLLMSIAYSRMTKYYSYITSHFTYPKTYVVRFAITAAGITSDEQFIHQLLLLTKKKKHRKTAIQALKSYGPKIIDIILKLDKNNELKESVKKYLPRIIESFKNDNALKVLMRLLRSKNATIRVQASNSLVKLKRKNLNLVFNRRILRNQILKESNYYRDTLEIIASIQNKINIELSENKNDSQVRVLEARQELIRLLEIKLDESLECIFNLLSLIYNESDIEMTYIGIKSEIKEARINSLEFLDNLLQNQIKLRVLPIIEHYVIENNHYDTPILKLNLLEEKKYLEKLLIRNNFRVKIAVLNLIKLSKNKSYISIILPLKKYRNQEVKILASDTLNSLRRTSN